ncbi:hypothetical protein WJX77_006643 [Trebouxia sp. C0004]
MRTCEQSTHTAALTSIAAANCCECDSQQWQSGLVWVILGSDDLPPRIPPGSTPVVAYCGTLTCKQVWLCSFSYEGTAVAMTSLNLLTSWSLSLH